jgi:hypothetical protein
MSTLPPLGVRWPVTRRIDVMTPSAFHQAGSRPGSRVTFFASPKKVTKERRPGLCAPRCARGSLRCSGWGCIAKLAAPAAPLKHVAMSQMLKRAAHATPNPVLLGATHGTRRSAARLRHRARLTHAVSQRRPPGDAAGEPSGIGVQVPVRGAEERRGGGGARSALQQLTHRSCLSGAQRSEFCDAPPPRAPQGTPRSGAPNPGSPFFGYFLWRRKESDPPAGAGPGLLADHQSNGEQHP